MPLLPHARILEIHAAAIATQLAESQDALLVGLDRSFVESLPRSNSPSAQLAVTLDVLNKVRTLRDGSVPFAIWLANAITLTRMLPEAALFEVALREVEVELSREEPPPSSSSPRGARMGLSPVTSKGSAPNERTARIVVWYAPQDRSFADGLFVHLDRFEREGRLSVWSVDRLKASSIIAAESHAALDEAHVVVALVSADYLASPSFSEDLPKAIAQKKRLLPVLVRPCLLEGTIFEGATLLPEGGRALLGHPARESAIVAIVQAILDAGETAIRLGASAHTQVRPTHPTAAHPPDVLPGPQVGARIDQVFPQRGPPAHTFVAPAQLDDVVWHLGALGAPLILEGPTQSGKSTVVRRALEDPSVKRLPSKWISCRARAVLDELRALHEQAEQLEGYVIVEDAHLLLDQKRFDKSALRTLGDAMKMLADVLDPKGKIVALGINRVHESLADELPDLADRMDVITMTRQAPERIRALVERGQSAANVSFTAIDEIVTQSLRSFKLAQEICYQLMSGQRIRAVPPEPVVISASPNTVRPAILARLRPEFEAPLVNVASADRDTARPGACLALLTLLAVAPDMTVPIGEAMSHYPHLEPSFRWIQDGHLEEILSADVSIAALLSFQAGAFSAHDPRLQYYLQGISWKPFAKLAGPFDISERPGEPVGISPLPKAANSTTAGVSVAYPWAHENGVKLHQMLVAAYDELRRAERFLKTVPVDLSLVERGAIASFWTDALDAAAKQGQLTALVQKALADDTIKAYHPYIEQAALALSLLPHKRA